MKCGVLGGLVASLGELICGESSFCSKNKQKTSLMANLDMITFSLFTNVINFWCVRNGIQMTNVIRECFHQQGTAQWSMAHAIFGGLSHAMTVFQQALCCVCVFLPS